MGDYRTLDEQYQLAKAGMWDELMRIWQPMECAHYTKLPSGWTFLHQAAFFGNDIAIRELIKSGASPIAKTTNGETPVDIAMQHGHVAAAALIEHAASSLDRLWLPPTDSALHPSSSLWNEAIECKADSRGLWVKYGGSIIYVKGFSGYFTDSFGRVLVGWHGTYNPPCDMDGHSMLDTAR